MGVGYKPHYEDVEVCGSDSSQIMKGTLTSHSCHSIEFFCETFGLDGCPSANLPKLQSGAGCRSYMDVGSETDETIWI